MTARNRNPLIFITGLLAFLVWAQTPVAVYAEQGAEHTEESHAEDADHSHAEDHGHDDALHADDDHGHGHEHAEEHPPEVPDALFMLSKVVDHDSPLQYWLHGPGRVIINCVIVTLFTALLFRSLASNLSFQPKRGQSLLEIYIEMIDNFVCGILGKEIGRKYVPFLGTLAIYIWFMNLAALIPGMMSPTTYLQQTFALSVCVFIYVQYTALKYNGIGGFLFHLAGEPRDFIGWLLVPLFFPLHVIGELIKPVSLALRLRGNIMGEHILLGVFAGLGIMLVQFIGWQHPLFGLPLHGILLPIALLGSTIQAMVFMTLATIYIYLVLPHHDHDEGHAEATAH